MKKCSALLIEADIRKIFIPLAIIHQCMEIVLSKWKIKLMINNGSTIFLSSVAQGLSCGYYYYFNSLIFYTREKKTSIK